MGCDIHPWVQWQHASGFTRGFLAPLPRNYVLFGCLTAGAVRWQPDQPDLVAPRGHPPLLCMDAQSAYLTPIYERIVDSPSGEEPWYADLDTAARWLVRGESKWAVLDEESDRFEWTSATPDPSPRQFWQGENPYYGKVSGPDWHTPSWLYADELDRVQAAYAATETPPAVAVLPEGFPAKGATEMEAWDDAESPVITEPSWDMGDFSRIGPGEGAAIRAFAEERIAEDGSCRLSKFHYPAEKWGPQPELAMTIAAMRAAEESGLANVHLCFWFDN